MRSQSQPVEYDAIVIGAGPAGTSAAAVLAEKGRSVLILEREKFPRYRVGESLIPFCYFAIERLGLIDELNEAAFANPKLSVQFVATDGRLSKPFYFVDHNDHPSSRTWQVVRSDFDQLLLGNALAKGAEIRQETAARQLIWQGDSVIGLEVSDASGGTYEVYSPITIDASGRDTFSQLRNSWRIPDKVLKKIAIWTYYKGAKRDPGRDAGATTVAYLPEKGWFWYIPLADDMVSVGVVADREYLYRDTKDPAEIFQRELAIQPWVRERVAPGMQTGSYRVTGDYSYRSRHCATNGLVLAGDAFSFLDPVFSSGVFLALTSGVHAGEAVEAALKEGDFSAERFEAYGEHFCQGIEAMRRLVYAFYDHSFNFADFLKAHPDYNRALTDCLIGNVYDEALPGMFEAMKAFAELPAPLSHGRPLVPGQTTPRLHRGGEGEVSQA
ncbi:MAG: NAD(P)/FAD-dependent oxidoreductase [Planctomycetota bacterium]